MTGNIYISGQIGTFDGVPGVELIDVIGQVKKQPQATAFNVHINCEVVTVNGVTAGDFILATTSDPIDGGQVVYARSTAENTVFIGILNGSITEQASGTRIIKLKILK